MRHLVLITILAAGCGATTRTSAAAEETEGSALLVRDEPIAIPGTEIVATLREIRAELPREDLPQDRGFVDREPARAWIELASRRTVEEVRWYEGHNAFGDVALLLVIARDGSARLGVDRDAR